VAAIDEQAPDLVAVSYRLTPDVLARLLAQLAAELEQRETAGLRWVFGGTPPAAEVARASGIFAGVFSGRESQGQLARSFAGESGAPSPSARPADTIAVAAAFLAAYNAKQAGVRHYVAQYLFNPSACTAPAMDLAKILAKIDLIEEPHDEDFTSLRETRAGLASLSADPDVAKGQLAASVYCQLALGPQIAHIVGISEGDHAALPEEIIESAAIVRGVIETHFRSPLGMLAAPEIQRRRAEFIADARVLLQAIAELPDRPVADPWTDLPTLAQAVAGAARG